MNHPPVWYPPQFPLEGRLPRHPHQVYQNLDRQEQLARDHQNELSVAAGRRVLPPCCKTLHISLCFDGTGNNLNNDFYLSDPKHPTNIARLFRASIGDGHAGGTAQTAGAERLIDPPGTGLGEYFKYYMPGVGTPFPEIGDLDYSTFGLAFGGYGEKRINWALLMIVDALRRMLGLPRLDNVALSAAVRGMGTLAGYESISGHRSRSLVLTSQLEALHKPLRAALLHLNPGQPKLLGVRLYVYGFSRGAAAARAFVSWLSRLLTPREGTFALDFLDLHLPITVEYLGLLDTVASVGLADIMPSVNGHMSWADGNQQLPENGLVKRCLHIVASHEQRLCFPLESIRREDGGYPDNCVEVVYPGVHSDQGGGYPPGDQGKAWSMNNSEGDGLLLSQIALNDLYADAFAHGAPLKVPEGILPEGLVRDRWRWMDAELVDAFDVSSTLVTRFNAWREATLGLAPSVRPLSDDQIERYQPLPGTESLENAVRNQMDWLTAWRIDRYGFLSLKQTEFYRQASDAHADLTERSKAQAARDARQATVETSRERQDVLERLGMQPKASLMPGVPDFDADIAQTQLREAAEEFAAEFRGPGVLAKMAQRVALVAFVPGVLLHASSAEARAERERMRDAGKAKVLLMFPPPVNEVEHFDENRRASVDENRNASKPEGLLRSLFDDQVHDSRAWFLYAQGKEPGGTYFSERMVFFGDAGRRDLALYGEGDGERLADHHLSRGHAEPPAKLPPVMDAERLAHVHKAIDELFAAHHAKIKGRTDAGL
jgi:hypothetical protein